MQHDGMRVPPPAGRAASLARLLRRRPGERGRDAPARPGAAGAGRARLGRACAPRRDARPRGAAYVAAPGRRLRTAGRRRRLVRRSAVLHAALRPEGAPRSTATRPGAATSSARRPPRACSRAPGRGRHRGREPDGRRNVRLPRRQRAPALPARRAGAAVTHVIEVPPLLDDRSFDQFAAGFGAWPPDERCWWTRTPPSGRRPTGSSACCPPARRSRRRGAERPLLTVPANDEVTHYWARAGFFAHAAELFEIHGTVPRATATGPARRAAGGDAGAAPTTSTPWWRRSRSGRRAS